jgi:hypothetical protein
MKFTEVLMEIFKKLKTYLKSKLKLKFKNDKGDENNGKLQI